MLLSQDFQFLNANFSCCPTGSVKQAARSSRDLVCNIGQTLLKIAWGGTASKSLLFNYRDSSKTYGRCVLDINVLHNVCSDKCLASCVQVLTLCAVVVWSLFCKSCSTSSHFGTTRHIRSDENVFIGFGAVRQSKMAERIQTFLQVRSQQTNDD